jgi:glycosyltransferase 2 family protein
MFNQVTPGTSSGGQPYKAYHLSNVNKQPFSVNLSTILFDFATNAGVQSIVLFVSFFYLFALKLPLYLFASLLVVLGLSILILLVLSILIINLEHNRKMLYKVLAVIYHVKLLTSLRRKYRTLRMFRKKIVREITRFNSEIKGFFADRKLVSESIFFDLVTRGLLIFQMYVLFLSIGVRAPLISIIIVYSVSELTNFVMFTPGGIGIVEAIMIGIYGAFGIPFAASAVVASINRFFLYIYEFLFGYIAFVYLKNKG